MITGFVRSGLLTVIGLVAGIGCTPHASREGARSAVEPPPAPREFRAVWVATVANIDWPSKPGLPTEQQKAEAIAILDRCAKLNINAIIFQVRPGCDAMYASKLEPWSLYLTGEQGKAPEPSYDPLQFWIEESHKRGMELHAWFNPYRARHTGAKDKPQAANHVSKTNPSIVKEFNGWQWLDPAEPEAQDLTYNVFMDVVKRYDVDGIHIDDYFYPYPNYYQGADKTGDFPDHQSWQRYQQSGGTMTREDWRRHNVDQLIERIYKGTKRIKKHVKFGISPFGQPNKRYATPGIDVKFSQYDILYADAEKWLEQGWLDYWTPQLYWPIAQKGQEFPLLVDYWISKNTRGRHFWPGLYTSRFAPPRENTDAGNEPALATRPAASAPATRPAVRPEEIVNQIDITRQHGKLSDGHVHFSMVALMRNRGLIDLLAPTYAVPALVPASPWLDSKAPARPSVKLKPRNEGMASIDIRPGWGERPRLWAIWYQYGDVWSFEIRNADVRYIDIPQTAAGGELRGVWVSAVDRSGNESPRAAARP